MVQEFKKMGIRGPATLENEPAGRYLSSGLSAGLEGVF